VKARCLLEVLGEMVGQVWTVIGRALPVARALSPESLAGFHELNGDMNVSLSALSFATSWALLCGLLDLEIGNVQTTVYTPTH